MKENLNLFEFWYKNILNKIMLWVNFEVVKGRKVSYSEDIINIDFFLE